MRGTRAASLAMLVAGGLVACSRPSTNTATPISREAPVATREAISPAGPPETRASAVASASRRAAGTVRYLALGDSFTIGTGSSPEQAFPAKLAERLRAAGREVVLENPARNGYTSADVLAEEAPLVATFRPTFVTVAVGANDIVRQRGEAAYRETVRSILAMVKSSGATLVGLPQPDWAATKVGASFGSYDLLHAKIGAYNDILREEIERAGGRFVDLSSLMDRQAKARLVAPDGLHPSAAAHAEWAEALADAKLLPPP